LIPLPKNLAVDRDHEEEKDLLAKAKAYLEQSDRTGIHATDLLDPRIAFFKKQNPSGVPDRLVNVFIVGQIAHAIIEVIKGSSGDYTKPDAGTRLFDELHYSPDFLNYKGEPDEIKTTRSFYLPKVAYLPDDDTYHMYLEQLLIYMAAEDKTVGRLTLLYLNSKDETGRTAPQFYVWKIETTPEALEALRGVIKKTMGQLNVAIEKKDHNLLPLCRAWKCRGCEYWEECKPEGRYGVPEKEWLPRKTKETKKK
jgi:hypothetical protein